MPNTPERPTARQIVRDDAAGFGWTLIEVNNYDIFSKDDTKIVMGWRLDEPQRLALGVWLEEAGKLTNNDYSPMCIIRCREWLRNSINLLAPMPADTSHL